MKSAVLARASGARRVIGFSIWHLREKTARPFYSETGARERSCRSGRITSIHKNLTLLRSARHHRCDDCDFRSQLSSRPRSQTSAPNSAAIDPLRLINPGAAWPNKRWPPDRFGEVAAFLRDVRGLPSFVLWGPGEEGLAGAVVETSAGAARVAPPTGLPDLRRAVARRLADGVRRYRATAHRHRGRHADRFAVRSDRPASQRAMDRQTTWRCRGSGRAAATTSAAAGKPSGAWNRFRSLRSPPLSSSDSRNERPPSHRAPSCPASDLCPEPSFCGSRIRRARSLASARSSPQPGRPIRVWAAGHLEKGREVTTSGPYALDAPSALRRVDGHRNRVWRSLRQHGCRGAGSHATSRSH